MLIVTMEGNKYYVKLSKKMESVESGYYAPYNRQMAGYNHKQILFENVLTCEYDKP